MQGTGLSSRNGQVNQSYHISYIHHRNRCGNGDAPFLLELLFHVILQGLCSQDALLLFDNGNGNKEKLVNVSELAQNYTAEHCTAIIPLTTFTSYHTTSALKGLGNVKPLKHF
jgi:hypothetical protein